MFSTQQIVYNLPPDLLPSYPHGAWVVRARNPNQLAAALTEENAERAVAVRLLALDVESEVLNAWLPELPIELVMGDPAREYPLLYRHTNLLDNHPVLAAISVQPGFLSAVKVAVSLDFAVRLEMGQPDPAVIAELGSVLDFYLHQTAVEQPVEFFDSVLLGFYHDDPVTLWSVLEEEPPFLRYVADNGVESGYGRLAGVDLTTMAKLHTDTDGAVLIDQVLATAQDCRCCEFLSSCGGYFKWPDAAYDCTGIKGLFAQLRAAALEIRQDLAAAAELTAERIPSPPVK